MAVKSSQTFEIKIREPQTNHEFAQRKPTFIVNRKNITPIRQLTIDFRV